MSAEDELEHARNRIARLEEEVDELRQANEILKTVANHFAAGATADGETRR